MQVSGIRELTLSKCGLRSLPSELGFMPQLKRLDLSHNYLAERTIVVRNVAKKGGKKHN